VNLQKTQGNLQRKQRGKPQLSHLTNAEPFVKALVAEHPDATLVELCELFAHQTGKWVSTTAMCRYLQKLGLNRKKKHGILDLSNNSNPFPRLVSGVDPLKCLNSRNQRFNKRFNGLSIRTTLFYCLIFTIFFSLYGLLLTHNYRTYPPSY
jgi:hypothetical protein